MFGTKSFRGGGALVAASLAVAMVLSATSAWAGHARSLRFLDGDLNPSGEVGPGFGTFPDFPAPAVGPFPDTRGMTFRSQLVPAEINAVTQRAGVFLNDIWGWTSPKGQDYALIGTSDGLSIVRVTDPDKPVFIGQIPTSQPANFANLWGDAGVYTVRRRGDDDDDDDDGGRSVSYVYYTTEAEDAGINILELNQLDDMGPAPDPTFQIMPDASFAEGGYRAAHNVYINQESGFAYLAGVTLLDPRNPGNPPPPTACDGDPNHPSRFNTLILDLKPNPLAPVIVACLADRGEHDFYVISNYRGPDREHRGKEIAFVFDGRDKDAAGRRGQRVDTTPGVPVGGETEIWDVSDKDNIRVLSTFVPEGLCFSHAGWTSSKRHEFLLINDEIDELRDSGSQGTRDGTCTSTAAPVTANPSLYIMNIRDLDNPVFQERFFVDSPGDNDHNFIRDGNKLFWSIYNGGSRVLKMRKRRGKLLLEEIAALDSEPRTITPAFFNGQWGIFPFRGGKTIVAADIVNGLIVMSLGEEDDDDDDDDDEVNVASNDDDDDD